MAQEKDLILGRSGSPREILDIDELKADIVEQLREARVEFPIRSRRDLGNIYPYGTPKSCVYKGIKVSLHDLIPLLEESDFPIRSPGDAATMLVSKCELK
jgi:hypothetical protein